MNTLETWQWCQWRCFWLQMTGLWGGHKVGRTTALWIQLEFTKLNLQCIILRSSEVSPIYISLQDSNKVECVSLWDPTEPLLQPPLPLPYIAAENNSTPKQTGKCLMILYPSTSSWCQWNIAPWAHIYFFLSPRLAVAGWGEGGRGTKSKPHYTPSNEGANGKDGMEENVTWKGSRRWMVGCLATLQQYSVRSLQFNNNC